MNGVVTVVIATQVVYHEDIPPDALESIDAQLVATAEKGIPGMVGRAKVLNVKHGTVQHRDNIDWRVPGMRGAFLRSYVTLNRGVLRRVPVDN